MLLQKHDQFFHDRVLWYRISLLIRRQDPQSKKVGIVTLCEDTMPNRMDSAMMAVFDTYIGGQLIPGLYLGKFRKLKSKCNYILALFYIAPTAMLVNSRVVVFERIDPSRQFFANSAMPNYYSLVNNVNSGYLPHESAYRLLAFQVSRHRLLHIEQQGPSSIVARLLIG